MASANAEQGVPLRFLFFRGGECAGWYVEPGDPWEGRRFPVQADAREWARKPEAKAEREAVSRGVVAPGSVVEATAPELAAMLSRGRAVLPGLCGGRRTKEAWRAQALFFIDVDNDPATLARGYAPLTHVAGVGRAYALGLPLLLSYETFGSVGDGGRYRLVFAAPRTLADRAEARTFALGLLAAYPEADPCTVQCNRLFYGTDKEVCVWERQG